MHASGKRAGIRGMALIGLCLIGAVLLAAAALMSGGHSEEEEWIPLNAEVASALGARGNDRGNVLTEEASTGGGDETAAAGKAAESSKSGGDADGNKAAASSKSAGGVDANNAADSVETAGDTAAGKAGAFPQDNATGAADPLSQENSVGEAHDLGDSDGKLDVNRATAEQLDELKGIGPAKAQAIVDERESGGFFSSVDDLQRVKGIGEKLVAGIKDSVVARP